MNDLFYGVWLPDKKQFVGWPDDGHAQPVESPSDIALLEYRSDAEALASLMEVYGYDNATVVEIDPVALAESIGEVWEVEI